MTRLAVAAANGPDLLICSGRPVWPIFSSEALAAINKIVVLFKAEIEFVTPQESQPVLDAPESVVVFDEQLIIVGQLYAHLTGRVMESAIGNPHWQPSAKTAVVVILGQTLSPSLANKLWDCSGVRLPGIICGSSPETVLLHALRSSAALALAPAPVVPESIEIFPFLPISELRYESRRLLGSSASTNHILAALCAGVQVLSLSSHGGLYDAQLPGERVLCGLPSTLHSPTAGSSPCVWTGRCYRLGVALSDLPDDMVIRPEAFQAGVMLLEVCHAIASPDTGGSFAEGLVEALLSRANLGALVASFGAIRFDIKVLRNIIGAITDGETLGTAIKQWFRDEPMRGRLPLLFGDPGITLCMDARGKGQPKVLMQFKRQRLDSGECRFLARIGFIRACLYARSYRENDPLSVIVEVAKEAIHAVEYEIWRGGRQIEQKIDQLIETVLTYGASAGDILDDWYSYAIARPQNTRPCSACGGTIVCQAMDVTIPNVTQRVIGICRCCGLVEDRPRHLKFGIDVVDGYKIRWQGGAPPSQWRARLTIFSGSVTSVIIPWPSDANGYPIGHLCIPDSIQPGPFRAVLTLMIEGEIVMAQQRARKVLRPGVR